MAETPFRQEEVADATYCTVVLTVLPLAGEETETLAKVKVPELSTSRRANFLIRVLGCKVLRKHAYRVLRMDYPEVYVNGVFHSRTLRLKNNRRYMGPRDFDP
jgi:hypothetical protein